MISKTIDGQKLLTLRAIDTNIFCQNLGRDTSKNLIELIPPHKPEFDYLTLMELISFLDPEYILPPNGVYRTKGNQPNSYFELYSLRRYLTSETPPDFSFKIVILDGFSSIHVYIKNYLGDFQRCQDGTLSIVSSHIVSALSRNPYSTIQPIVHVLAEFFYNKTEICPETIITYFQSIMISKKENSSNATTALTLDDVLATVPGWIRIIKSPNPETPFHYLTIVFPWARDFLNNVHYIELDASFRAVRPYVFCVTQGIFFNESIPLGITIGPSENKLLYQLFFDVVNDVSGNAIDWKNKSVLSDMGTALIALCKELNVNHFFCHRHILEHFGSSSPLAFFCRRLLKCLSLEEFQQVAEEVSMELELYLSGKEITDENKRKKIEDLKTMLALDQGDSESNYYYTKWALWYRKEFHVGRCSNHNEAFHSVLNNDLKPGFSLCTKIKKLIDKTIEHFLGLPKRYGDSIQRKINKQIDKIRQRIECNNNASNYYCDQCSCSENGYNEAIYGVPIPCIHRSLSKAKGAIESLNKKLIECNSHYTINRLLVAVLTRPFKASIDKQLKSANLQLHDSTNEANPQKLDLRKELISLNHAVHACFTCKKNPCPHCIIDQSIHDYQEYLNADDVEFPPQKQKNPPVYFKSVETNVDSFVELTPAQRRLKGCLFETMNEICALYPKKRDKQSMFPFSFCLDFYTSTLTNINDENLILALAKFKIDCWSTADEVFGGHKFSK